MASSDLPSAASATPATGLARIPLFDIDWTLLAGGNPVHRQALFHALRAVYGIASPVPDPVARHGMIDTEILVELVKLNGGSEEQARAAMHDAMAAMAEYYAAHAAEAPCVVLDGVVDLLQCLRNAGLASGLLTGNIEPIGWMKVERAGLAGHFAFGAFGNMAFTRADLVAIARARAREALGREVGLDSLFLVGDSPRDVACGRAAGIPVVAVASGAFTWRWLEEAGADVVLDSLCDQEAFFRFMQR